MKHDGMVLLYAETYVTFDEYCQMLKEFMPYYNAMRIKYGCDEAFPHAYDKISMNGRESIYQEKFFKDEKKKS